jgi:hypothetical protein
MTTISQEHPQLLQQMRDEVAELVKKYPRRTVFLVLRGDWGGQIYLTVPAKLLGDNAQPLELLQKLDEAAWDCNEGEGASMSLQPHKNLRLGVFGGMGGGQLLADGVWLHEKFVKPERYAFPGRPGEEKLLNTNWQQLVAEMLDMK